jgi:hypothetical protein
VYRNSERGREKQLEQRQADTCVYRNSERERTNLSKEQLIQASTEIQKLDNWSEEKQIQTKRETKRARRSKCRKVTELRTNRGQGKSK